MLEYENMLIPIIIACILLLIVIGFLFVMYRRMNQPADDKTSVVIQTLEMFQNNLRSLENTVQTRMESSEHRLQENLRFQTDHSRQSAAEIASRLNSLTDQLSRLDETNKHVLSFTDQLRSFQDILKNPKQRGTILGEYYLETILSRVLPPGTFKTQYGFPSGEIVDAVVFVGDYIIPIDSKFSLDNYNRIVECHQTGSNPDAYIADFKKDIKLRIDETAKYIQPQNNTLDFAFMFIPHESIYYDLLVSEVGTIKVNTQDLVNYAFQKKVIIVSPTSFLAYLQTVLQGLRALKIEKSALEIRKNVEELGRHMKSYEEYHGKIGTTMSTLVNHYNASGKEFKKIDKDITRITSEKLSLETIDVDKPMLE